jgi:hypothetical protein
MKTRAQITADYRQKNRDVIRDKGRKYYQHNPRRHKNNALKRRYGITIEQYDEMVRLQNNLCAICGQEEVAVHYTSGKLRPLSVDHNHVTGKVRALLCHRCNAVLGFVEKSPELLQKILKYRDHYNG